MTQTILENANGITLQQLKTWLKSFPEKDKFGENREVWVETGKGTSSVVKRIWPLNVRDSSADILIETGGKK